MSHYFTASLSEQGTHFFRVVDQLKTRGGSATASLYGTFIGLLAVEVAAVRDRAAPEVLQAFRDDAAEVLAPLGALARLYVELVREEAESARDDAWEGLCRRRSAIEVLVTVYAGTPVTAEIQPPDVERLDSAMRRVGQEQGPVHPERRQEGVPASHWWWRYPETSAAPSMGAANFL